jgi:hypothetical protein
VDSRRTGFVQGYTRNVDPPSRTLAAGQLNCAASRPTAFGAEADEIE